LILKHIGSTSVIAGGTIMFRRHRQSRLANFKIIPITRNTPTATPTRAIHSASE